MKVLHINTVDIEGGAAQTAYRLHQALIENQHESSYWVKIKKSQDASVHQLLPVGALKKTCDLMKRLTGKDAWPILQAKTVLYGANDIEWLKATNLVNSRLYQQATTIHCHNLHGNYFSLRDLMFMSNQKRLIWTLHDMWPITGHCSHSFTCERWRSGCGQCPFLNTYQSLPWDNSGYLWRKKSEIYTRSQIKVVAPSRWLANKVKDSILNNQQLHVIPNGVDTTIFCSQNKQTIRRKLGLPLKHRILLFSAYRGLDNKWKGGSVVKELASRLSFDKSVLILCIGINKSGAKNEFANLLFHETQNSISRMAELYAAADLLLHPSQAENLPLSVLESMSCGTPALAYDVGGTKEIIQSDRNGLLVPDMNADLMYKKIVDFLNYAPTRRRAMSASARSTVLRHFDFTDMFNRYQELYAN